MDVQANCRNDGHVTALPGSPSVPDPVLSGPDAVLPVALPAYITALPRRRGPLSLLTPIPKDRRVRRFSQLLVGLVLYGFTMGLMVRAVLGLDPWDVFHQGITRLLGRWIDVSYGTVITVVSVLVLLAWIPLRQRPGIGTVLNAAIIGWTTDATLSLVGTTDNLTARILLLAAAVIGNAVAGALYIGAGLGPGPRDGLMTGMAGRGIGSIRVVRTSIEIGVLGVGWLLGGAVGIGTVIYALAIGPLLQLLLPRLSVRTRGSSGPAA